MRGCRRLSCHRGTVASEGFHLAEGCADYVAIITPVLNQTATIVPKVTVTYNPASTLIGVCAG
jgi:hypothetical protein